MSNLEDYLMGKAAEVSGTTLAPISAPTYGDRDTSKTKTIRKMGAEQPGLLPENQGQSGEQIQKEPQAKPMRLRVDATAKEMPTVATEKTSHYALPSHGRYPIDTQSQVKEASSYFVEWHQQMVPEHRREFSVNLVKRAAALGLVGLPAEIRKYGGAGYAHPDEVDASLQLRRGIVKEAEHRLVLDELAQTRVRMLPEDFAVALGEFDKVAGISEYYDSQIHDPYYSTYGEKRAEREDTAIMVGNDYVSHEDLKHFARTQAGKLTDAYGAEFVKEFREDPVAVTKSLPMDQKKHVMRLVSSALTDATTT